ncbi:hypothetical protein J3R83DRAFT_6500 [Lanmaoa asiatica]|nr:hypothetical protein J3R83DRAFT_6500 [Lanmaoa asiatica]
MFVTTSPWIHFYKNAVVSVSKPPTLLVLLPDDQVGWCQQFSQEGYNVIHLTYPLPEATSLSDALNDAGITTTDKGSKAPEWGLITYGLATQDAENILSWLAVRIADLRVCVHFCPNAEDISPGFLIKDSRSRYLPVTFHLASSQENFHASILPLEDPANLGYDLLTHIHPPIKVYTYPFVSHSPPFPFPAGAPVQIAIREPHIADAYSRSANNLSLTRTLETLKRYLGPHFDFEKLWGIHTYYEFAERDASKTMTTMVRLSSFQVYSLTFLLGRDTICEPCGIGHDDLARFYKVTPTDFELITVSRTIGSDRIVDEMIFKCSHTSVSLRIFYLFVPGIQPTGKPLEIAMVGIIAFQGDKLFFEYWDQASVLVQLGLLDPTGLPIAGVEIARKVLDPFAKRVENMLTEVVKSAVEPTGSYNDPFGDGACDEPFSTGNLNHDDTKTFVTYTSGVSVRDPTRTDPLAGPMEAESLAADYRRQDVSPSFERPGRLPTPSPHDSTLHNPNDVVMNVPYRDVDSSSSLRPSSVLGKQDDSLVQNAAEMGQSSTYQDLEYAEPSGDDPNSVSEKGTPFRGFLGTGKYPMEQRIEDKKRGIGRQKHPFVVYALTIAMVGIFINELVVNSRAQGTPVSFKASRTPVVNPMLGPSESALINLGARFPPCMKSVQNLPLSTLMPCLNDTANPPNILCTIEEVCGFGGFQGGVPNQWFRFITAIFLHAGFIHILLNMLAQLTVSAQIEREMGSMGFMITYFAAGIFGNVLGGNFSLVGTPSIGASGAIFGTVAVTWVDLFAHWNYHYRPGRKLAWMTVELLFGIALGYVPCEHLYLSQSNPQLIHVNKDVDNFAHLGGLCMGLLVGTTLYPVISPSKRHKSIMWAFRLAAIPLAVVLFVVLIRNFYTSDPYAGTCIWEVIVISWSFDIPQHVPVVATYLAYLLLRITTAKELASPLRVAGQAFNYVGTLCFAMSCEPMDTFRSMHT